MDIIAANSICVLTVNVPRNCPDITEIVKYIMSLMDNKSANCTGILQEILITLCNNIHTINYTRLTT